MSWQAVEKILDDLEVTVVTKENSLSEFTGMGRPYPTASKREFPQVTRVTLTGYGMRKFCGRRICKKALFCCFFCPGAGNRTF